MISIKRLLISLLFLSLFAPLGSNAWVSNKRDAYQRALKAKERGQVAQAITYLHQALARSPEFAEARFQLALIYLESRRYNEAEAEFRKLIQEHPDSIEAHENLAWIYAHQGKNELLDRELQAIARLRPDVSKSHVELAQHYMTLAMRSLWNAYRSGSASLRSKLDPQINAIAAANPENPESYFVLGHIARLQQNAQRASEYYTKAGQLNPEYEAAQLLKRAGKLNAEGEIEEALDSLLAISTMGAGSPESESLTASILVRQKDYVGALKHLEAVSAAGAKDPSYLNTMAQILEEMGQNAKAIPYLESLQAVDSSPALHRRLAAAYKENGDINKAIAEYEKLLKTESDTARIQREIVDLTQHRLQAAESKHDARPATANTVRADARLPVPLLYLPASSRCAIVEKESQTLLLFRSTPTGLQLDRTFACSTGAREGEKSEKGDLKTPEGIYIFRKILTGNHLPNTYGKMAITLDYPNSFDRLEGKGGNGIWVHATNEVLRPYLPNKTKGCVVVSNEDIQALSNLITLQQTPIVIVSKIRYQTSTEAESELASLKKFLADWSNYWRNKLIDKYISMYSPRFRSGNYDVQSWKTYKSGVFSRAGSIQLDINLDSAIHHDKYVVLTLREEYRSDRLISKGTKRLFLVQEESAWRIIAEDWMEAG
jgi:murein L,D-transpeptidase YafK/Tfp pilus assembly protein PilF